MALFYYNQFQVSAPTEEDKKAGRVKHMEKTIDFFDPESILRGRVYSDGSALLLLRDGHEDSIETPLTTKNGVKKMVRERKWVQSEIMLAPEDMKRLRDLTEIYEDSSKLVEKTSSRSEKISNGVDNSDYPAEGTFTSPERIDQLPQPEVEMIGPNDKY